MLVAAVPGVDDDGPRPPTGDDSSSGGLGRRAEGVAGGGVAGAGSVVCAITSMTIRPAPRSPAASEARNDANRGPRSTASTSGGSADAQRLHQVGQRRRGQRRVERIGVEPHQQPSGVPGRWCAGVAGSTSSVMRASAPPSGSMRAVIRGTRRSPVDDQPRRPAQLEPGAERRRERPRHEINRDEPAPALLDRRRRQRHHPAGRGGQRLSRGQRDGLRLRGDRQSARQRILAQRQVEELREIVEREHLLSAHLTHGERAPRRRA